MNTVGKPGRLGEHVRCVVSVSMLTEGWDANTVTHILGVRAFGTQLLCEQVVGRGLRRVNYDSDDNGMFEAEYADVLGVPFTFVASHAIAAPKPPRPVTRIHACPEREAVEIRFPRVVGYRVTLPSYPDASGPECTVLDQAGRLDAAPTARAVKLGTALAA
jgi:type III restriction enzyme